MSGPKQVPPTVKHARFEDPPPGRRNLLVMGEDLVASYSLPSQREVVIGRDEGSGVRLDHPSISRRHAVLHTGPALSIEDCGSTNGTRVRGRWLDAGERAEIAPGEVVVIGHLTVMVQEIAPDVRRRHIWAHGYFEGRLEEEVSRAGAGRKRRGFAVARLCVDGDLPERITHAILSEALRSEDVVGFYGPGELEIIYSQVEAHQAKVLAGVLEEVLSRHQVPARIGFALFPSDGTSAQALLNRANPRATDSSLLAGRSATAVVFCGDAMKRLQDLVERIAVGSISVLLMGETGVGKEVMAEVIHRMSPRAGKAFLRLNCAALSESLVESELFGHVKGAFTGAHQDKPGLLEMAQGGTVLLDEIGELSLATQAKLLRVLEDRRVQRVGGLEAQAIDVRFIAATNRDLETEIARGGFRSDLYFRVSGVTLVIPPLRERIDEIVVLAEAFAKQAALELGRAQPPTVTEEARACLESYSWPGNIRELRNVVERAVLLCAGDAIRPEHLPLDKMRALRAERPVPAAARVEPAEDRTPSPAGTMLDGARQAAAEVERQSILDALADCAGNQTHAARMLGISRRTLIKRLDRFGIPRPRKRDQDGT